MATIGFTLGDHLAASAQGGRDQGLARLTAVHAPGQSTTSLFGAAMERAATVEPAVKIAQAGGVAPAAGAAAPPSSAPVGAGSPVDGRERARRTLGLDAPEKPLVTPPAPEGNAIIEGLQKLRGVFDERVARLDQIMSSKNMDVGTLMSMQMELVRFSLLVEVTSKLTGKSTQAFDTLMKGQ